MSAGVLLPTSTAAVTTYETTPELQLAGAERVVLEMPDGSRVVGASGDQLPDRTLTTMGAGWAPIGNTRLAPGHVVQIRDGRPPQGDVSLSTRPAPSAPRTPTTTTQRAPTR